MLQCAEAAVECFLLIDKFHKYRTTLGRIKSVMRFNERTEINKQFSLAREPAVIFLKWLVYCIRDWVPGRMGNH